MKYTNSQDIANLDIWFHFSVKQLPLAQSPFIDTHLDSLLPLPKTASDQLEIFGDALRRIATLNPIENSITVVGSILLTEQAWNMLSSSIHLHGIKAPILSSWIADTSSYSLYLYRKLCEPWVFPFDDSIFTIKPTKLTGIVPLSEFRSFISRYQFGDGEDADTIFSLWLTP